MKPPFVIDCSMQRFFSVGKPNHGSRCKKMLRTDFSGKVVNKKLKKLLQKIKGKRWR